MIPEVEIHRRLSEELGGDPNPYLAAFHEDEYSRERVLEAARVALGVEEGVEQALRSFLEHAATEGQRGRFLADMLSAYGPILPVASDDLYALWLNRGRVQGRLSHAILAGVRYALGSEIPEAVHAAVSDSDAEREERAFQSRKAARAASVLAGGAF